MESSGYLDAPFVSSRASARDTEPGQSLSWDDTADGWPGEVLHAADFEHSGNDDDDLDPLLLGEGGDAPVARGNLRSRLHALFRGGKVLESARVNHQFTLDEKEKLHNFDSIDYLAPNSAAYRKWLARQPHRRQWDRWLMMASIGFTMGIIAHLLQLLINGLAWLRVACTRRLLQVSNMGVAWLFNCTFASLLAAGASALVVGVAPAAVSSGVPEVMAYLNGLQMPKIFNIHTVAVKFLSAGLAVASGLPVGPEGPLIHIGAAMGMGLSQGHSTTLGFSTGIFKRFRNPKHKRDFVTAGVAVGVATAFNAPIGGLLFAMEEVASFWEQSLGWQAFSACVCGVLALNLARSFPQHIGWFQHDIQFEVGLEFSSHILAVVPAAIIGAAAGALAVLFTGVVLRVARLRDALLPVTKGWHRMYEPVMWALIFTTGSMLLPLFFPCDLTKCAVTKGHSAPSECAIANRSLPGTWEEPLRLYTCRYNNSDTELPPASWLPGPGTIAPGQENFTKVVAYNQLATLTFSTGEDAIKHLLARGTHKRFGYHALAAMLAWYFIGAAMVAGSAISSGLFVPQIMIGACLGRLLGLATTDIMDVLGKRAAAAGIAMLENGQWNWIDPGAFALVGAAAFMGGVTRLTVSLAVIMIEVSNDVHMLLPVLVGVLVAKWVGDAVTHPLYHGLLEVKCAPFLLPEPVSKYSLDLLPVSTIMHTPVTTLRAHMKVQDIQQVLRETPHNGFPVVQDTAYGQVFVGLVTRSHLLVLLKKAVAAGTALSLEAQYPELERKVMDPLVALQGAEEQQEMVVLRRQEVLPNARNAAGQLLQETVDLNPYINTSAFKVSVNFSIERTYILFRTMGLRHLTIVDEHNRVRGIVTRKDLLGYRLDEALQQHYVAPATLRASRRASSNRLNGHHHYHQRT